MTSRLHQTTAKQPDNTVPLGYLLKSSISTRRAFLKVFMLSKGFSCDREWKNKTAGRQILSYLLSHSNAVVQNLGNLPEQIQAVPQFFSTPNQIRDKLQ